MSLQPFLALLVVALLSGCGFTTTVAPDGEAATPDPWLTDDDDTPDGAADDDDASDDDDAGNVDDWEGDEAGECDDGADNDRDGSFDCDDSGCTGAPLCQGDDDDATDDDDAANDDDDAANDDDDAANDDDDAADDDDDAAPGSDPVIVNLLWQWNGGAGEFQFDMAVTDDGCDLGNPVVNWSLNGTPQNPAVLGGSPVSCQATVAFYVGGMTPGTWDFDFSITDGAGNTGAPWSVTVSN